MDFPQLIDAIPDPRGQKITQQTGDLELILFRELTLNDPPTFQGC